MLHFTNPISCPFGDKAPIKYKSFLPGGFPLSILIAAKNKQAKPQKHFNKCINQQMDAHHQAWVFTNMIKNGGPGWFIFPNKVHFNMMLATWRRWQVHGRHLAETFLGLRLLLVASNQTCFRSINLPTHPTGGRAGGHLAKTAPLSGLQAPPWGPRCAPPCTPKLLVASNTILLPLTKLLHFSPAIRSGPTQTCNYSKRRHWQD